jgi:hypothetical protein
MSEYTRYFAVKAAPAEEIRDILRAHQIVSIVNVEAPVNDPPYQWIVVCAPADSGLRNGEFYYESQWPRVARLFSTVLCFWMDESQVDWRLTTSHDGEIACYEFCAAGSPDLTSEQIARLAALFDVGTYSSVRRSPRASHSSFAG